jgi:hypothetical protein
VPSAQITIRFMCFPSSDASRKSFPGRPSMPTLLYSCDQTTRARTTSIAFGVEYSRPNHIALKVIA